MTWSGMPGVRGELAVAVRLVLLWAVVWWSCVSRSLGLLAALVLMVVLGLGGCLRGWDAGLDQFVVVVEGPRPGGGSQLDERDTGTEVNS